MMPKSSRGFSLLEVLLAITVVTVASLGAYALFDSGIKSNNMADAENQAVEIANVYTDLASSNLTNDVAPDKIAGVLQNSGRLSNKYFSGSASAVVMRNAFGVLTFPEATAYSFSIKIPLGCLTNTNSNLPQQFLSKVQDSYSCNTAGSKVIANCSGAVTACSAGTPSSLILYYNLNN
jgi:prepilin-type N-terminal cleavage/methylation domain-containing protein